MSRITRRSLLSGAALAAATGFLPRLRRRAGAANADTGRKLVIVMCGGGWDTTYAIDPKPGITGIDVPNGQVETFSGLPIFTDPSRPAVGSFFERYADRAAIVNGISVRTISHPECAKRVLTGSRSNLAADVGAIVGHELGTSVPLPYLVLGPVAFSGPLAASTVRVGTTNQLKSLIGNPFSPPADADYSRFVASGEESALLRSSMRAQAERELAQRGQRGANRRQIEALLSSMDRAGTLRTLNDSFAAGGGQSLAMQAGFAAQFLEQGLTRSIMLDTRLAWDTHNQNSQQNDFHQQLYEGLTVLLDDLDARSGASAGNTLLDETVVLVVSEMTRTPQLNASGGKDHWPTGSALVMGGGVRGGTVCGGTNDSMQSEFTNLETGALDPSGVELLTGNVIAGVLELLGVDFAPYLNTEALRGFIA